MVRCIASVIFFGLALLSANAQTTAIDVGSRLELFVDTHLTDTFKGAALALHAPVPSETVLQFDSPWEGRYCGYVTFIKDGEKFRLFYRGLDSDKGDGSEAECTCYAESADGIHFTKPKLGLFERNGTRDNNVILSGMAPFSHNFAPMLDTNPACKPEQRYKALAGVQTSGLVAFVSPDGIHWTKLREEPVLRNGVFDSQNVAFWSEKESCYLAYFRTWTGKGYSGFRTVSRATSPDFVNWSETAEMSFGDSPREHLYTNQTTPYFRAPHLYVATAARFMQGRRVVSADQAATIGGSAKDSGDCSDTVLMTSRGGTVYDRTFMEGFVRPGIGMGNWTTRTNYPTRGIVPVSESEMAMYVQRNYGQPTHHLQRLTLRIDGFASLHAPYTGGECVTKPLAFAGRTLVINYSTSAAGSVWVELQDAAGAPLPGFTRDDADEIIGDEIAHTVTWKGKSALDTVAGKPIRIRFILKDADVYSLQFKP